VGTLPYVTKVPALRRFAGLTLPLLFLSCALSNAQTTQIQKPGPAQSLYLRLSSTELDPGRVFRVRDSSLDRPAVHITLEDGTIAFTKDILGKITGAFFEGDGEVLLVPPNEAERKSMSLFTGMAILEERFTTAYLRFNDNTAAELQPGLREPEDPQAFVARWNETATTLAQADAMRMLASFSELLPISEPASGKESASSDPVKQSDRLLHVRLQGNTLGAFDILFDSAAGEQIEAGQTKSTEDGTVYYNVWTSFSAGDIGRGHPALEQTLQTLPAETQVRDPISVRSYVIDAQVKPPKELDAEVQLDLEASHDESRFLVFELSRFLKIQTVEENGQAVEFIQNPAVEGTRLARSGNDLVAVVLRAPVRRGQKIKLRFVYGGEVLAEAGKGLLYVGARGTWYPNRGIAMSNYDLTFHYPASWTLVATGKLEPISEHSKPPLHAIATSGEEAQMSHWVSERPIPVAGFDLGKYVKAVAHAGNVDVETYATGGVERDFPSRPAEVEPPIEPSRGKINPSLATSSPSPSKNANAVADLTARSIRYYTDHFGPFPYSKLALTQLPGRESQGWPGLVFLSSYAFLTPEERAPLHMDAAQALGAQYVPAHEAAHQWWGDLITWKTYRDQWVSEGLANYSSLLFLKESNPIGFREMLEKYRRDLVRKNKDGRLPKDAGPVTLGGRLLSSQFPEAYEAVTYGRGTWLFYMLHAMLLDAATEAAPKDSSHPGVADPFMRALRTVRERYEGKAISTRELLDVFAEDLPPSLRYEGKASLDWFLDGWVSGTSLPKLELQAVKFTARANGVTVSGILRQKDGEDNLVTSVPLYAVVAGKAPVFLGRVFADGPESSFRLSAPAGTHKLLVDPKGTILTSPK